MKTSTNYIVTSLLSSRPNGSLKIGPVSCVGVGKYYASFFLLKRDKTKTISFATIVRLLPGVATMAAIYDRRILFLLLLIFTTLISSLVESFSVMSYSSSVSKQTKISSTTNSDRDVDVSIDDAMIPTYDKLAIRLIDRYQKDLSSNKL